MMLINLQKRQECGSLQQIKIQELLLILSANKLEEPQQSTSKKEKPTKIKRINKKNVNLRDQRYLIKPQKR